MRIEIFANGGSSVFQMQSGLDSLHSGINETIQALKKTRRKIERLPGSETSYTSEAIRSLQNRINDEQSKMERVEKLSQDVNAFLGHTAQTDAQVSRLIAQNQSKFFADNPWSKPISSGNSSAWDRFLDGWNSFWSDASDAWNGFWSSAVEGWNNFWDDAQNVWRTVKEGWEGFVRNAAEVLKKAWTGVVTFVKEHAVELIVGTVAIVVGAVLVALTAGAATPFLAAFGGALLAGLKAAAVSAVVGGAISTVIAAFTGEDLLTAFADGFASGYMWGGIFFAIGAAINFMKPKLQAIQKTLKNRFQSWRQSQSWRSESGRILVNPKNGNISSSEIWNHIKSTQANYPGTELPRSFTVDTPNGSMWAHPNATEHIYEALKSGKFVTNQSDPKLMAQLLLDDYRSSLSQAISNGIQYGKKITVGKWEFAFGEPLKEGLLPTVIHSKFLGFK